MHVCAVNIAVATNTKNLCACDEYEKLYAQVPYDMLRMLFTDLVQISQDYQERTQGY